MTRLAMATALTVAALTVPAWAQAPAEHDHSHSTDTQKSAPASPAPAPSPSATAAPQGGMGMMGGGMGNMPMMGMMSDMKNMMSNMSMMQRMGMMGRGMGGMTTIDRVEGRIAFLRAELKITDAQAEAWNGFAEALRANAKKLAEVRASMMPKPGDGQPPASNLTARLNLQEQWLIARLDGLRTMKSAFVKLNEVFSEDQKKTAGDLLAPHMGMGMGMGAMAMMPAQKEQGRMPGMGMGMGKR